MNKQDKPSSSDIQRVIRVFVSSTFRDMKAERDYLMKFIFPQVRKLCEQRGVVWGEVDLRWGVTDEQKAEGKVLPICLEEIRRCRPYFIGVLGERYGWVPDEIPQELIEREEWLKEHFSHSVTELEILHGVLRNPDMAEHAFFYFRDPAYIKSLSQTEKDNFTAEDSESAEKLQKLKERIRKSGFPVRENYPEPKAFGELVLQDLTNVINTLYPEGSQPDPLARDAADHEAFAQSRARVYIGREEYFKKLDEHVSSDRQPLVILGESGSGKSALLSNWAIRFRENNPDTFLLMHFIGASPYSADWAAMLRRIMSEFRRRFDIQQEIPDKPDELRLAFANYLHMAAARGRVILILDALNQLEDREGTPDLVWLPPVIPSNIRLILSTLPGRPLDELKKRGWQTLTIELFNHDERRVFIEKYLAQYSRALSPSRIERIASAEQTTNPLYLQVFLEELRVFGVHERLDERINYYLEAENVRELFGKVLARWEEDYEVDSDLVGDAMSLIWASRRGLTESELLDILGSNGQPLPKAVWSPLYLAAESHLVSRSGFINFSHNYLREAVCEIYVPNEDNQKAIHLHLADYFKEQELSLRKVDELPYQLAQAQAWKMLCDILTGQEFFMSAWQADEFDVKAYWAKLENNSLFMLDAYHPILETPERISNDKFIEHIAELLYKTGHPVESVSLNDFLVEQFRKAGDYASMADCLSRQAVILSNCGEIGDAMRLLKDVERIYQEMNYKYGLASCLGNQANILEARGELDEAMRLYKEQERICRELGNKDGLQISLGNQGVILYARGDLKNAMGLFKEQEHICRELCKKDSLSHCLNNQATILKDQGNLFEAMALHKKTEEICRELGYKDGLSISLGKQGAILFVWGDLNGAMTLYKEQEHICRKLGDKDGLQTSIGNQGNILYTLGDIEGAMVLYKEQEKICRELDKKSDLSSCLGNQAVILTNRGDLDRSLALYKEQECMCRELGNKKLLSVCLGNQAVILKNRGDKDGALTLHKEEEKICRELGNNLGLSYCLGNQADILMECGDLSGAVALYKQEEQLCRELGFPDGIARSLANRALLLAKNMGRLREALPLAQEAHKLANEHGLVALANYTKALLDSVRSEIVLSENKPALKEESKTPISIPTPHSAADPNRAAQLNMKYQEELKKWKALPLWKRLRTKKPEPPGGI